jgi:hypothetical protein
MIHTMECTVAWLKWQGDKFEWMMKWLNSCPVCNGTGYDPKDPHEYCICILDGKCPRCGGYIGTSDDGNNCSNCGWDWGANDGDTLPEPPLCTCVEQRCEA